MTSGGRLSGPYPEMKLATLWVIGARTLIGAPEKRILSCIAECIHDRIQRSVKAFTAGEGPDGETQADRARRIRQRGPADRAQAPDQRERNHRDRGHRSPRQG